MIHIVGQPIFYQIF